MSAAPMLISVVIPTFNRAELLRKAVASVLAQRGDHFEVVISDNCSSDHTPQVVAEFAADPRVVASRNERNLGMVGNWRKGVYELARGEWFILMSDDDYLTDPEYLVRVGAAIAAHRPVFVYSGGVVHDTVAGTRETVRPPFDGLVPGSDVFASRGTVRPQDALLPSSVFRRADAKRLGFLDDPDNLCCDAELYLNLCAEGEVFVFPEPACVYLKHGANLIDRIVSTRRLLDHNLDFLVNPFVHARARGLPQAQVDAFRRNALLDRTIASTFLRLRLHDEAWFRECRDRIAAKIPDVVRDIERSFDYRAKRLLLAIGGRFLRARYPLVDLPSGSL